MNTTTLKRWASGFAFVFLSSLLMVTGSERIYWYLGGLGFEQNIVIALFYMLPTLAALWVLGSGPSNRVHQVVWAGLVFATVVEGVLTAVIYEDGVLPIMAALFLGWHGMLSVVTLWFLARKWLLAGRLKDLAIASGIVGLLWGIWSIGYRAPGAFDDFEEAFDVMVPGDFAIYALGVALFYALAHWLIGFVWPAQWNPGKWGRRSIVLLLATYGALAVLVAVPWAPLKFAVLVGVAIWLLGKSRQSTAREPSAIAALHGRVPLGHTAVFLTAPVAAGVSYWALWQLGVDGDAAEALFVLGSMLQALVGLIAFIWAAVRSVRNRSVANDSAQVVQSLPGE